MKATAILSRDFRITVPKSVRDERCWQVGQELVLVPKRCGVLVMQAPELNDLFGIAKSACKDGVHDRDDRY